MISIVKYQKVAETCSIAEEIRTDCFERYSLCGPSKSSVFNYGIEHSKGEYISFLDLHDEFKCDQDTLLYDVLQMYHPDILFCSYTRHSIDGMVQRIYYNTYHAVARDIIKMIVTLSTPLASCGVLVSRSMLKQRGIRWNESLSIYAEDWFVLDILSKKNIAVNSFDLLISTRKADSNESIIEVEGKRRIKFDMQEYPSYYILLKSHFGNFLRKELEDVALLVKFQCVDSGRLSLARFNSYLPTPISVIWRQTWSLKRKMYFILSGLRR